MVVDKIGVELVGVDEIAVVDIVTGKVMVVVEGGVNVAGFPAHPEQTTITLTTIPKIVINLCFNFFTLLLLENKVARYGFHGLCPWKYVNQPDNH